MASPSVVLPVQDPTQVGEARRAAVALAERANLSEAEAGRVALVVTELATNLARHGGGGELIARELKGEEEGLELVALDRGPGIVSVAEALRDGYSTAGTQGTGLGAVARLSSQWDLLSLPGAGTAILVRFVRAGAEPSRPAPFEVGGVCIPHPAEEVCGDGWAYAAFPGRVVLLVADGLGHGPDAARAAGEAVRVFREQAGHRPAEILEALHRALRSTRGAAVGVAEIAAGHRVVTYAGVGNIAGVVLDGAASRNLISHNGIVGHECRKIQEFEYPWTAGAMLVLYSDGLQTHWKLERYPGLTAKHPALVAGVLYRDYARGRDDMTVAALRETRAAEATTS